MSVFDGLADIFAGTFGEPVQYQPVNGEVVTIQAIWIETAADAPFDSVDTDTIVTELHLRAAEVPEPKEGDIATRGNGKVGKVVPPIRPDDKGMIACRLEIVEPVEEDDA